MTRILPLLSLMSLALLAGCESRSDKTGGSVSPERALFGEINKDSARQAGAFRVMTFNLRYDNPGDGENRWDLRREFAADVMRESGASLIGIQEGLHRQVSWLDDALDHFTFVGVGRDDGAKSGEYAAIFIDTTQFEIIDSGTFWLSETPSLPSVGWDASMERIATYAFVLEWIDESNGIVQQTQDRAPQHTPILILNTHFDHIGEEARLESARLIHDKVQELRQFGEILLPVIVMGDLNTEHDTAPIKIFSSILRDSYIVSETSPVGPATTYNGFNVIPNGYREPGGRIDYVFVSDEIQVNSYLAVDDLQNERYVSDHFPLLVELTIEY